MERWPNAVDFVLWPYALCYAVHVYNMVPLLSNGTSQLEKFIGTQVGSCMQDHHMFTCTTFALQNALVAGNSIPWWSLHVQLGLNLGPNPFHSLNVYLVLSLMTGLVLPQCHCCFDDFFKTTHHNKPNIMTSATWKQLAGLHHTDNTPTAREPSEIFYQTSECPWSDSTLHRTIQVCQKILTIL